MAVINEDKPDTPAAQEARNFGLGALIMGIITLASTLCCCIPVVSYLAYIVVPILSIVTIILSIVALMAANEEGQNKAPALAGLAMGIGAILVGLCGVFIMTFATAGIMSM